MKGEVDLGLGAATSSWCSMRTLKSAPEAERFLTVLMASDVAVRFRCEGSAAAMAEATRWSAPWR